MDLLVCGLDHRVASIDLRERFATPAQTIKSALQHALQQQMQEVLILSTCNRSEIYCVAEDPQIPMQWLKSYYQVSDQDITDIFYVHHNERAIKHLLQVSCGLLSMVLGEPQIFGQIKEAYQTALQQQAVGRRLNHLLQFAFSKTKNIRTQTNINQQPVSVAYAAVSLAKCIFSSLQPLTVLLIGAGDTIELAAKHFIENDISKVFTANRTLAKAQQLAEKFSGSSLLLDQIDQVLPQVDIVLTATGSMRPHITKEMVTTALKAPRVRPMFIIDLAVPRDVDETCAQVDGVYLYNIDDLKNITQEGLAKRQQAAVKAHEMIDHDVSDYMKRLRQRDYSQTIQAYRSQVELMREQEVSKALKLLQEGHLPEQVLQRLARSLTNKVMHRPSARLREAGYHGEDEYFDVAKCLLGLEEEKN